MKKRKTLMIGILCLVLIGIGGVMISTDTTKVVPLSEPQIISLEEAKALALKKLPGVVTDVTRETINQIKVYVVEIAPATGGAETDVFVDMVTGAIISVED